MHKSEVGVSEGRGGARNPMLPPFRPHYSNPGRGAGSFDNSLHSAHYTLLHRAAEFVQWGGGGGGNKLGMMLAQRV
jgi:hypothetical protein